MLVDGIHDVEAHLLEFGRVFWTEDVFPTIGGAGSAAKEAQDELKGLLASFDQLNVIQQKNADISSGGGGGAGGNFSGMFEEAELSPWAKWLQDAHANHVFEFLYRHVCLLFH